MDAIDMIRGRRSIRRFTEETVDRKTVEEILASALYAPTWSNFRIVRYTVIDNRELLDKLADEGFPGFEQNSKIVRRARGAIVVSVVEGKSGISRSSKEAVIKDADWEMFDAGIAAQTLCLAAYEKGVGTVILGIFDEDRVGEIAGLPEGEAVATIVPYGYPVKVPADRERDRLDSVVRFL